ncbi:S9 family peptidase [Acidipila sp. EB88]|uniref:S9 family peptidase n=1 Tax=Acidipila sp. EB88 TaxID=2305226 RepID=UPI0013155657|nr:S9 family peptidase [Acidipila sp. EB88]
MQSAAGLVLSAALWTMGACAQTAAKQVMQPADLVNLRTVAEPRISPDGRRVAYTVLTPAASSMPRNEHIWLVDTDRPMSQRPFVASSGVDTAPAWSPDGKHLAFLSNRPNPLTQAGSPFRFKLASGKYPADIPLTLVAAENVTAPAAAPGPKAAPADPKAAPPATPLKAEAAPEAEPKDMQLWWIAMDGGEAEPLTNLPGGVRSFRWSKDGQQIAFVRKDAASEDERGRVQRKDDREIVDHEYHYDRLWVLDVAERQARLLTRSDQNVDAIDWSPDGRSIVARVSPSPRLDDYWRVSKVMIFDATTGAQVSVIEPRSGYQQPLYARDGARVAFSRFSARGITDEHYVRELASGKELRLEDLVKGTVSEVRWLPENLLLVSSYVGAHTEAHVVDVAKHTARVVPALPVSALELDASLDGKTFSFVSETATQPGEISVWARDKAEVLTSTNPQVQGWALGAEREVQWANPKDGTTVYGVLSLPPDYTPGRAYKTVIHLHGGPEEAFTVGFNATWYNYAALLASWGYVVLQPNYRGSAGQAIAFTEGNYRDWGGGDFDDVMAGVDWLVKQGIADPNQMAIAGWSYGGYLTSWAVTHTDRFKAAMAGAPITDVLSMATTTDIAPSYLDSYLGPLTGQMAEYDRHSPVRSAEACHTPLLILQGDADVRVPLLQGSELYHALRFFSRETEMVTYPREPHIFGEREHQIDSLTRELAWFAQHLSAESKASTR